MSLNKVVYSTAYLRGTPSLAARFSERNILNSLAVYLAPKLMELRYLIYWHARQAVQTPDGLYTDWEANRETYMADPVFAAQWAGAQGLMTVVTGTSAVPRFVQRLIDDASVGPADVVTVPVISLELAGVLPTGNYEIGSTRKWRARHLIVDCYVRDEAEQAKVQDALSLWFDAELPLTVRDHDAGDLSEVGLASVMDPVVLTTSFPQDAEATTYEVLLNARLIYVA